MNKNITETDTRDIIGMIYFLLLYEIGYKLFDTA